MTQPPSITEHPHGACARCRAPFLMAQEDNLCGGCRRAMTPLSTAELDQLQRLAEDNDQSVIEHLDAVKIVRLIEAARRAPPAAADPASEEIRRNADAILLIATGMSDPSFGLTALCIATATVCRELKVKPDIVYRNLQRMLGLVS